MELIDAHCPESDQSVGISQMSSPILSTSPTRSAPSPGARPSRYNAAASNSSRAAGRKRSLIAARVSLSSRRIPDPPESCPQARHQARGCDAVFRQATPVLHRVLAGHPTPREAHAIVAPSQHLEGREPLALFPTLDGP